MIESRLAGWLATRADLAGRAGLDRLRRGRCGPPGWPSGTAPRPTQAQRDNAERSALERARYQAVYDIDLDDRSPYDLVLDSTAEPADDLADQVIDRAERFPESVRASSHRTFAHRRRSTAGLGRRRRRRGGRRR